MAIVRRTRSQIDLEKIKVDWKKLDATTDEEIDAQIAADPDTAAAMTDEDFARARWVFPCPEPGELRALRQRLGLTQERFAARFGFTVETIRNYEQGHRRPTGPARALLRVIAADPDAVTRALWPKLAPEPEPAASVAAK